MNLQSNYFIGSSGKLLKFDAHKVPVFKEERSVDWVTWGYDATDRTWNNRYGDYLIWLYNSSAKNNAIINGKNTYIVGDGWTVSEQGLSFKDKIQAGGFKAGLEASKITRDISLDRIIFGGFATEVIPNKKSDKVNMHHIDFSKIRVGKTIWNEDGIKEPTVYYYTADWSSRKPINNPDFTEFFDFPWDISEMDSSKRYIVYYKDYRPDLQEYPLPEYIGAIPYISADYEIGNFTFNNVKNGFSGGYLVNFYNGDPTEIQKGQIEDRWKATKHGGDNAGEPILSFNEDKDSGVEITPLPANGQDDRFLNLNEQIRDEIYTGHNFNPTLIGLSNSGGFNNNADELRVAGEMLQNTYVTKQQGVIEDFVNSWADLNEVRGTFEILKLKPVSDPVTETELSDILTINERRIKAGYTAIESGDVIKQDTTTQFNFKEENDEKIIKHLSMCGTLDEKLTVIDSRQFSFDNIEDARTQGDKFKFESKKANTILGLLISNPTQTPKQLADVTGLTEEVVNDLLNELEGENLIDPENQPTEEGQKTQQEIFVVYKYALRHDAPALSKGGKSRLFCKTLLGLSEFRSWTFEDIELLNNRQGLDVFSSRGGFYSNPKLEVTTPFCRHIWEQRLVTRK
jgi:predicted transcriptional regulator